VSCMRLLMLCARFPYPPITGDRKRTLGFIQGLSKQGVQITLFSLIQEAAEAEYRAALEPYCARIETVLCPLPSGAGGFIRTLLESIHSGIPRRVINYASNVMRDRLEDLLAAETFDAALFEELPAALYRFGVTQAGIPKVIDFIDGAARNLALQAQFASMPLKLIRWLDGWQMGGYERSLVGAFDHHITIAEVDRQTIGLRSKYTVIPMGEDLYTVAEEPVAKSCDLIFTGHLSYPPNVDAVCWIAGDILPRVLKVRPDTCVHVVGAQPGPAVLRLQQTEHLRVLGPVIDMKTEISQARLAIAPLRIASGLQIKVLEAMSVGIPVVATSLANNGMGARHGEEIWLADTSQELADAVVMLLENEQMALHIGQQGRKFVARNFSWEKTTALLMAVLQGVVANGSTIM
jgi:polysaccharide biosynthesis protein PslH